MSVNGSLVERLLIWIRTLRQAAFELKAWRAKHVLERGVGVRVVGPIRIWAACGSRICLGDNVAIVSTSSRNSLEARGPTILRTLAAGACISIGSDTGMTSATISAMRRIEVGSRVLIGAGVLITDSDHHLVDLEDVSLRRYSGLPSALEGDDVIIGDDVFIGARSIVLKGSRIGSGSVIGAGSVVSGSIPPHCVAAGSPCRLIRSLRPDIPE
jgi:acetyltransferase-like isoleucine patch superfamily enzyme